MQSRPTKRPPHEMSKVLLGRVAARLFVGGRRVIKALTSRRSPTPSHTHRMNPVSRFVALVLLAVLTALVALLAVPVWRGLSADELVARGQMTDLVRPAEGNGAVSSNRARQL